jgi:hypothetical protein
MLMLAGCLGRSSVTTTDPAVDDPDAGPWQPDPWFDSGPDWPPSDVDAGPGYPPVEQWDSGPNPSEYDAGPPVSFDAGPSQDACALFAFYADADGDGFGDPHVAVLACSAPPGHVANSADCYDGNASAHPGQKLFYTSDRGDGSFDYDCNGSSDQELTATDPQLCVCNNGCSVSTGWRSPVPSCGASGDYAVGGDGKTCDANVVSVTQPCR